MVFIEYEISFINLMITQDLFKKPNNELEKQNIMDACRMFPYEIKSTMDIKYISTTNYTNLLKQYNGQKFIEQLKNLGYSKLQDPIYVFSVDIQPQNLQWKIFHHMDEINRFMQNIQIEITMMNKYKSRLCKNGAIIIQKYNNLKKTKNFNNQDAIKFMQFLNLIANHQFLRKTVRFLVFVQHCVPLNLWNLKVIQQIQLYKSKNFIQKMFSKKQQVDYFLTVTPDGILISTKNLLETKIDKMISFTNQFSFQTKINADAQMIFQLSSCIHQIMAVNVQENYMAGINFYLGLKMALQESDLFDPHRFDSFSKARQNCEVKLYNDGQWYFSDLCDELRKAKHQVCITDWWMTPYFLLKRPDSIQNAANRLDGVLKQLNDHGVKIFIILFRQPLNILCNDSEDAQFYLESLGRNIRVRRHPIVPQLWSHHEKSVIIDQRVGFMGGLDICYGRWDTPEHSLTNKDDKWNGADYTNERLRGFVPGTTKNILQSPADRQYQPRMPWHDIGIKLVGDAVIDLARHFIQYWYFVDNQKAKDPISHLTAIKKRYERSAAYEEPDWQGEQNKKDQQKKKSTCGQSVALCGKRTQLFIIGSQRRLPQLLIEVRSGNIEGDKKLQICRSASPWSIGAKQVEHSIHNAYQQLIRESQNFVYIQNQFFMGKQNKIVSSLAQRIRKAHQNGENFKVVVVMPLLPGFQGDITDRKNSGPLRIQVHNQYQAISRGKNSLHAQLSDIPNFNIDNYIYFFGLRGHAKINKKPVTEIIYVHSKLMIVDDKRAIIGSANINDRSLLGSRDSQLAIVVQQGNGANLLDGKPRRKDIFQFRCNIFNEHFGLTPEQTANINQPKIWAKVISNARNNSLIYRKVFGCYPDNTITVAQEVSECIFASDVSLYDELIPKIFAHAVELPLNFMKDENLEFQFGDTQGLAGQQAFL